MFDALLPRDQASYDAFLNVHPEVLNNYGRGSYLCENLLPLNPLGPDMFSGPLRMPSSVTVTAMPASGAYCILKNNVAARP